MKMINTTKMMSTKGTMLISAMGPSSSPAILADTD